MLRSTLVPSTHYIHAWVLFVFCLSNVGAEGLEGMFPRAAEAVRE